MITAIVITTALTLVYLGALWVLTRRRNQTPDRCPECGRLGTVSSADTTGTVRHCPWCASVWIERKDRR